MFKLPVTVLVLMLGLLTVRPAQAQGLVENYLASFEGVYSTEFVEEAYCLGMIYDTAVHLGEVGLREGDEGLVSLSQAIIDRQNEQHDEFSDRYFQEFNPELADRLSNDELSEAEWELGFGRVDEATQAVYDSERYYFLWDYISYFEWIGIYAYCSEVYLPEGAFSKDVSVSAIFEEDAGADGFWKPAVEYVVEAGELVIDWTKNSYHTVTSMDVCEGDFDFIGGAALGTAATAKLAGDSVLVIIGSSTILVATAPAIASGVTVTSLAGATVFLTAKGYCYLKR